VFDDADGFGSEFDEFQEDFPAIGQFDDAVKAFNIKKVPEVAGGINAHSPGHHKAFGIGFNVTNPDEIDIQIRKGFTFQKLQEKLTGFAAANDGYV
jgi:hypothetical protein